MEDLLSMPVKTNENILAMTLTSQLLANSACNKLHRVAVLLISGEMAADQATCDSVGVRKRGAEFGEP